MAFTLGGTTIPNPRQFFRRLSEKSVENTTINGVMKKKTQNRKEIFILVYQYLTNEQVNSIMSLYEREDVLDFVVNDGELIISSTSVLMDVDFVEYTPSAEAYRQNLTITLTEVI